MKFTLKVLMTVRDYVFLNINEELSIITLVEEACEDQPDELATIMTLFANVKRVYQERLLKCPYYWNDEIPEIVDYWDYTEDNVVEVNKQKILFLNTSIDYFV